MGQSSTNKPKAPSLVQNLAKINIKRVSCGNEHTAALAEQGQVYAWGLNTLGALGVGNHIAATDTPVLVEKKKRIV